MIFLSKSNMNEGIFESVIILNHVYLKCVWMFLGILENYNIASNEIVFEITERNVI